MKQFISILLLVFTQCIWGLAAQSAHSYEGVRTVVIDAGHGGYDPGNLGTRRYKTTEKDITLAVSLKLGAYIKEHLNGVNVVYTRQSDRFVTLQRRAEIANQAQGDVFISIHCDAFSSNNVYGATSLVLGRNHGDENRIALQENAAIMLEEDYEQRYQGFDPTNPESAIGLYMIQGVYLNESVSLAKMVQDQIRERVNRRDRGVKQQPLYVTSRVAMPAVLVELGFLTHHAEEDFLNTEKGQDYMASAIFRAVRQFKEQKEALLSELNAGDSRPQATVIEPREVKSGDDVKASTDSNVPVASPSPSAPQESVQVRFAVQIITLSKHKQMSDPVFKGQEVQFFEEDGLYKYYSAETTNFNDAQQAALRLRKMGFTGAFVIGIKGQKKISALEAKKLLP